MGIQYASGMLDPLLQRAKLALELPQRFQVSLAFHFFGVAAAAFAHSDPPRAYPLARADDHYPLGKVCPAGVAAGSGEERVVRNQPIGNR